MTSNSPTHDAAYKAMFSHPEMVASLLQSFPADSFMGKLVRELDLSTLQRLSGELVSPNLVRKFSDMVWRVERRDKKGSVILILEFQSTPDRLMAFRFAEYAVFLL